MTKTTQGSPYRVAYKAENCGAVFTSTKRKVVFKFGFSDADAIAAGKHPSECRGPEHVVEFLWSVTAGKRRVLIDGQMVHYSAGDATESKFEVIIKHAVDGDHDLKLIGHVAAQSSKANPDPNWQQYDLYIDGLSFHMLPSVHEIGQGRSTNRRSRPDSPRGADSYAADSWANPPTRPEVSPRRANDYSPRNHHDYAAPDDMDFGAPAPTPAPAAPQPVEVADLLSFDAPAPTPAPAPQPVAPVQATQPPQQQFAQPPAFAPGQAYQQPAAPAGAYYAQPQQQQMQQPQAPAQAPPSYAQPPPLPSSATYHDPFAAQQPPPQQPQQPQQPSYAAY